MSEDRTDYSDILALQSLTHLTDEAAVEYLGLLIDSAFDCQDIAGTRQALVLAEELQQRKLGDVHRATLLYFLGNAWENIRQQAAGSSGFGGWEQEGTENAILSYRRALQDRGFTALPVDRQCQILTNLANQLSYIGRLVEAVEYWDRALTLLPSFGMARGNRGYGRSYYARALYDHDEAIIFLRHAHADLAMALDSPLYPEAQDTFRRCLDRIAPILAAHADVGTQAGDDTLLGTSEEEREYRRWCLTNRLFLNPLNDLGNLPLAARDNLRPPNVVTALDEGPHHIGCFNQLKQEFVSARYLFFEGLQARAPHFADRGVLLYNTLDYPMHSLGVEKLRLAFRSGYSLLDKIAFLLNWYLRWNIPESSVNFRTCWYESQIKKKGMKATLLARENWPLRGLFWLSKDLFEDKSGFRDSTEPDARELYDLRNHLEHKYLKLHDDLWSGPPTGDPISIALADGLAYSLSRRDFERKTLRLLKMGRAALIYLSLTMQWEEHQRARERPADTIIPSIPLDVIEDDWKM